MTCCFAPCIIVGTGLTSFIYRVNVHVGEQNVNNLSLTYVCQALQLMFSSVW